MSDLQLFGIIISVLLSAVAYFTKQLHRDFKNVEKDLGEVKTTTTLIKAEFKGINDLMIQRVEFLEKRLNHLETNVFRNTKDV